MSSSVYPACATDSCFIFTTHEHKGNGNACCQRSITNVLNTKVYHSLLLIDYNTVRLIK